MRLSRNVTNVFNWILDNLVPSFVRDSRILMTPLFYLLFGKKYKLFMNFKAEASRLSSQQMQDYYKVLESSHIKRETDLNKKSIAYILNNIEGSTVLDISCGRGYLANKIVQFKKVMVTGIDFIIPEKLKKSNNPKFIEATITNIPFENDAFETVICTHTLEHIVDIDIAISELRRVCAKRLIIVVPRQKEYKYTFDLHVHFFPYKYSLLDKMNYQGESICKQNDWLYMEQFSSS